MSGLSELERKVLALVREGGARASWHWLGTRAPSLGFPVPDVMPVLKELARRGLVERELVGGGMDHWTITPRGVLEALAAALGQEARLAALALVEYIDDGPRLASLLLQIVALDGDNARRASLASLFLRPADQNVFACGMMEDSRAEVRIALFEAWAPPRNEVPGQAVAMPEPAALDTLLRAALVDVSLEVRCAATAYAFAAGRGAPIVEALLGNVDSPEHELRCWTLLALGAADDDVSRAVLEQAAVGPDPAAASAAIRAIAARTDHRDTWLRVLEGEDWELRRFALFALSSVARALTDVELARITCDGREDTQSALAHYLVRQSS